MVQAWYINDHEDEDQRNERHLSPPKYIDLNKLKQKTGILYWKIDADHFENDPTYSQIRKERGYTYQDKLEIGKEKILDYESKLKEFFTEHIHADEEIRYIIDGSGYFDVRDRDDKWIRIKVNKSDLIILPAGIYHRFTLDHEDYIKVIRLFVGEPVWNAINRPADNHPARIKYLKSIA